MRQRAEGQGLEEGVVSIEQGRLPIDLSGEPSKSRPAGVQIAKELALMRVLKFRKVISQAFEAYEVSQRVGTRRSETLSSVLSLLY